jgi:thymidine kinase
MFTLILGPMKSGKSLELIARVAPYEFAEQQVLYVQPLANVRDEGVRSRLGLNTKAASVQSLAEIRQPFDVIGVDEVHMFDPSDVAVIDRWLQQGKAVFISGLDLDYRAQMPPIVQYLLELKPDQIIPKIAVCDTCHSYCAQFTQILHNDEPVLQGLPIVVPEDGTYEYQARCRNCFLKKGRVLATV